jgi:hypothetical protein
MVLKIPFIPVVVGLDKLPEIPIPTDNEEPVTDEISIKQLVILL